MEANDKFTNVRTVTHDFTFRSSPEATSAWTMREELSKRRGNLPVSLSHMLAKGVELE